MFWWEKHPEVLLREVSALEAIGMNPIVVEAAREAGRLVLLIRVTLSGQEHDGQLVYPDLFPYFRPLLFVQGLGHNLRHYNPLGGNLCLYGRSTEEWHPGMTAAQMLQDQLPKWDKASTLKFTDSRVDGEDHQAEPLNNYLGPKPPGQLVSFVAPWTRSNDRLSGMLRLLVPKSVSLKKLSQKSELDLMVVSGDHAVSKMPEELHRALNNGDKCTINIPWVRMENPREILLQQPIDLFGYINTCHRNSHAFKEFVTNRKRSTGGLLALSFPEESPCGGYTDGWIFVAYPPNGKSFPWFINTEPCTKGDIFSRVPELAPLQEKTVAVVGLGCVGAPSILKLAKAGIGELRLLDGDYVSPGTACRWGLGFQAIGKGKVKALTEHLRANYPFTIINDSFYPAHIRKDPRVQLGLNDQGINQIDILEKMLDGADLLYDASAEVGINHLLSNIAAEKKIHYLSVASRPGGWGGRLVRIRPGLTRGCFVCYLHHLGAQIPHPSFDPSGDGLQVVGCADPTFFAAGFDVEEISLAGVRAIASTLCENEKAGYPSVTNDVSILSLRTKGELHLPKWEGRQLERHKECRNCTAA